MSQGIAVEGLRLVKEYLPRAFADAGDLEARAHMMSAAMMGATAFQKGLGAVHALSHPIGAVYGTHHGTTNAVVIPPVLDFNRSYIEGRIETLNGYLDIKGGFDGFKAYVQELNDSLGIPKNLTEMGVEAERIDELSVMALADPSVGGNPVKMTLENTKALFKACM
ncbi:MAG: iron-containing alcohol dehydrogenase, partial [Rhodobacteraceae bacterium]|nr:iron-containing alcohol dehydrogenase [Paracoccaceae bacterium]